MLLAFHILHLQRYKINKYFFTIFVLFFLEMTKIVQPFTHTYILNDKKYLPNKKGLDKFLQFDRKAIESKSLFMMNIIKPVENLRNLILIKNVLINTILLKDIYPIIYQFFIKINIPIGRLFENIRFQYRQLLYLEDCFQLPKVINKIEETSQTDEITNEKYTEITIYYTKITESDSQKSFLLYK